MLTSPWGLVQVSETIIRGVERVATSGHGGIMVEKIFGDENFSKEAIKRATVHGNYYCYEEDCEWAIPMLELKDKWKEIYGDHIEECEKNILKTLSLYDPDYLLVKGITPLEPEYTQYKEYALTNELRMKKSPDLIISAKGSWHTGVEGTIEVQTADNKCYLIKEAGYGEMTIKLLSKCEIIKELC